jgi:hypothetical protein
MNLRELLQWQYAGYAKFHASRSNLLIHIVVVPLFLLGTVGFVAGVVRFAWIVMIVSVALQGRGHRFERHPPEPFTSAANALARILLEQWITFPRFVLNGAWWRALQASRRNPLTDST